MSLARSRTTRLVRSNTLAPNSAGPNPPRKSYDDVKQGIKILYEPPKDEKLDADIIFVPGLGTDPEKSWQSGSTDFNWIKDHQKGLAKDFPKARILLFQYESAWIGRLRVKQFIYNIAMTLLVGLRSVEIARSNTPKVLIGHSMGGLVIAKAVTIAESRRDMFPTTFECISGCVFFGTPFGGCSAASAASMLALIGERLDKASSPALLQMMSSGDEGLRELRNEFMRLASKLSPKIELFCFWEEQPTNFAEQAGLPSIFGIAIPKTLSEFVTRDSATLPGIADMGLASNHRNLVKFDSPKDGRFQLMRDPLKRIIHGARLGATKRLSATRNIDRETIRGVMKTLDSPDVQSIRKALGRKQTVSSWLIAEQEYQSWLRSSQPVDTICIRGQVGRGKTSNVLAVINDIENKISSATGNKSAPLLVYFFCDVAADQSSAEDILKSFLKQLVEQQEMLLPYAKQFEKKRESSRLSLQLTIENMWQSIQDMLYDDFVGDSTVHFIINNIHILPEDSPSTRKLLGYIGADIASSKSMDTRRMPVRWLLSSRKVDNLEALVGNQNVRLIDLEDERYEDQVQKELRKHAYTKVSALREEKKYDRDVAYFAHSLIGKRAQNTQWIDIACLQLKALSANDSRLKVRQILDTMPQDLNMLLGNAWQRVFQLNSDISEKLKEMLRAMVITFEDPTASELEILAGMSENDDEKSDLRVLVERCRPLLVARKDGDNEIKIGFMNVVVKTHLSENSGNILGLSSDEIKWQHGMLAFRAFKHLTERLATVAVAEVVHETGDIDDETLIQDGMSEAEQTHKAISEAGSTEDRSDWGGNPSEPSEDDEEEYDEDDDSEDDDPEAIAVRAAGVKPYTVRYWLRHAGKASNDIAEDLATLDDIQFWSKDSQLRRRWLFQFTDLDGRLEDMPFRSHSGLHIAAAVGFPQLVHALIRNGHESEILEVDDWDNTPLHLAAYYDQAEIIDVLLQAGAELDHGKEKGDATPLNMAAAKGFVQVMKKLIARGADVDAFDNEEGPVINSAIASGNREAVELLINSGAKLSMDDSDEIDPPLAVAAINSDTSLFDYFISVCADKIPHRDYGAALIAAAGAGQTEVFQKLLGYNHPPEIYQQALDAAAEETKWEIAKALLERWTGLDCHKIFIKAAIAWDDQSEILAAVWKHTKRGLPLNTINDALYEATDYEKEDIVRLLLEKFGADANATAPKDKPDDEETYGNALTAAAFDGTINIVKMLLEKGAMIDSTAGWPLQAATIKGHLEIVQLLLDRGADVNAFITDENFEEGTALQGACEYGQTEIVKVLLKHGAKPNHGGGENVYPLISAAGAGEADMTKFLIEAGANVNVYGGSDRGTPLINAAMWLPIDSVKLLLETGAEINAVDGDGDSALTVAAFRGDSQCLEFLLDKGANIMHANNNGLNALQLVLQEEHDDCLQILVDSVSRILSSINIAVDAGNEAVVRVLRSAGIRNDMKDHKYSNGDLDKDDDDPNRQDQESNVVEEASKPPNYKKRIQSDDLSRKEILDNGRFVNMYNSAPLDDARHNYQEDKWHSGDIAGTFESRNGFSQTNYEPNPTSAPLRQSVGQQSQSQSADNSNTVGPVSGIRRRPMPGSSIAPSGPSGMHQPITPPPKPYGPRQVYENSTSTSNLAASYSKSYGSNPNTADPPTSVSSSMTNAPQSSLYQAYSYPQPAQAHDSISESYPIPSQQYQAYSGPAYQQPAYQSYTGQPTSGAGPPYMTTGGQQSGYNQQIQQSSAAQAPGLTERRSSSNLFNLKETFGKARHHGVDKWKA